MYIAILGLLIISSPCAVNGQVVISEFMASNTRTLADEDGEFVDWIELHNTGTTPVNLSGWSLTDSPASPTQWRFPATNLQVGAYMVVFASGKDRRTSGAPLHTNFRLSGGGEYLALVGPDGTTIASEFNPAFPSQVSDISYGVDSGFRLNLFLPTNGVGRLRVPISGADGANWILKGYDDSSWLSVTGGVGFTGGSVADLAVTNNLAGYWNFDETSGRVSADSSGLGNAGALRNFPTNGSQWVAGRLGGALNFRGGPSNDYVFVTNYPKSTTVLTVSAWVWAESRPAWATIAKNWPGANPSHFHFGLQDTAGDLSNYIRQNNTDFALREGSLFPLGIWQHVAFVLDANTERLYRNGVQVSSVPYSGSLPGPVAAPLGIGAKLLNGGASADSFWHGKLDEVAIWNRALTPGEIETLANPGGAFGPQIAADTKAAMFHKNATTYLRYPFVVDDPALYRRWILRMKYDDGFVVWLNGQEVARRNAPEVLAWNSTATNHATASAAEVAEIFNLAEFENLITAGTNILAIQALNVSADDLDFFVAPSLDALSTVTVTNALVYFTSPTPGSENLPGVDVLGPIITRVNHAPAVPVDAEDLIVTARVVPAFAAVTNVTLRYRVMYTNEVAVTMFDDGAHGDGIAGDGLFGAAIPASASTNGQMLRYAITSADALGRTSRAPLFNDPLDSDQYFGTIVANPAIATSLPVFHWFVGTPAAAETDTGTRCSLFYNGEFYDNIFVRIRGGTSRSWPKKSYKMEFNEDHEFELRPGEPRVTEFDFNTTYTDKSYVRAVLSYEHQRDAGLPSPVCFLAHLRQNSAFYSVTIYTEQPDKDYLHRVGLDENGSFYKCGPGSTYDSLAGFEKKTRIEEGTADLQALLAGLGLTGAALETYVFDNIDVPGMVNFMATIAITQNIDASDKNHFLHRDTEGTREWRMLPWDQDLTFGPDALNTDTIVFNFQNTNAPACASHPFIGARPFMLHAAKYNRLLEAIVNVPRARDMLLRRIRTLSDEVLATGYFQRRIDELVPMISRDVTLDKARWGANVAFGGTTYTLAHANDRIKTNYLAPRRSYLNGATIAGVGAANPGAQLPNVTVSIAAVEFNPASGDQSQEYICLTNGAAFAVELTGWRIEGGIDFAFKPGTVMPSNSTLYVAASVPAFRTRTGGARGGQGLFVTGPFSGQLSARGETLRLLNGFEQPVQSFTYVGAPSLAQRFLRVSELMYHPSAVAGNTNGAEEFEFIELKNISTNVTVSLTGVRFINGVEFDFTGSTVTALAPGQTTLVVRNLAAFTSRYGAGAGIAGQYTGSLENNGERLQLVDASGEEILDFSYDNNWYPITDGLGFSLVIADEFAVPDAWSRKSQWRTSGRLGGSPSLDDPAPPALAPVVINEALTRADVPPPTDTIELHNPTAGAANISGWFLSDDFNSPKKFRIPSGTTIPAGGFVTFDEAQFNVGATSFALSSDGDEVWLFSADAATNLTGYVSGFRFGAAEDGVSFGRHVTSTGGEHFVAQASRTLGSANAGPKVGPIVIAEVHYHPTDLADGSDNEADEFIELRNVSNAEVLLYDSSRLTNTWKITGGVDFTFPTNQTLATNSSLLLVNFNPTNLAAATAFRAKFSVDAGVPLFGPYAGKLDNAGADVELKKPTTPLTGAAPYVMIDQVEYRDAAPWPAAADGSGASLQRVNLAAYGNDPANWIAATPTAGSPRSTGGIAPTIAVQPNGQTVIASVTTTLSVLANGSAPLRYQWRRNSSAIAGATNSLLSIPDTQAEDQGDYSVLIYNAAGSAVSSNATVNVIYAAFVLQQPAGVQVRVRPDPAAAPTTNASFSVVAYSTSPLRYQWRLNGSDLPGATSSTLIITNVQVANGGDYTCAITDDIGTAFSAPARLSPLVTPIITQKPTDITVAAGSDFSLSIEATGNPLPFAYSWRRNLGSVVINTNFGNYRSNFITLNTATALLNLTNNIVASNFQMRVVIYNDANRAPGITTTFNITVLADTDRDGIPDVIEQGLGLDPNNLADAQGDLDLDGMRNRDEYLAGTDPIDSQSYLRIDQSTVANQTTLLVAAVSNRTYSVQFSDSLAAGSWNNLVRLAARPTNRVESIPDPTGTTNRYYRVVLPAQP